MENEFLTGIESEGISIEDIEETLTEPESAFDITPTEENQAETENSDESSPKTNENETEPSQEGEPEKDNTPMEENLPFHKHPRFKEIIEENKNLKDEIAKVREDVSRQFEEIKKPQADVIPESFKKLYGDSPEIWDAWKTYISEEKENWKKDTLAEIKAEAEKQLKEQQLLKTKEQEAQKYFESQFQEIEKAEGKIDRNAVVKILEKYPIYNKETGLYDVKGAYDIYKLTNKVDPAKALKRKAIADASTSTGGSNTEAGPVTWDSIRNKGFSDF